MSVLHLDLVSGVVSSSGLSSTVEVAHGGGVKVVVGGLSRDGAGASGGAHYSVKSNLQVSVDGVSRVSVGGGDIRLGAKTLHDHGGSSSGTGKDATSDKDSEPDKAKAAAVDHNVGAVSDLHSGASGAGNDEGESGAEVEHHGAGAGGSLELGHGQTGGG